MTMMNSNIPSEPRHPDGAVMSDHDLAVLGLQYVAYVKPVEVDGEAAFSIHAADGTEIAVLENRDVALATILQHDMQPVCVH